MSSTPPLRRSLASDSKSLKVVHDPRLPRQARLRHIRPRGPRPRGTSPTSSGSLGSLGAPCVDILTRKARNEMGMACAARAFDNARCRRSGLAGICPRGECLLERDRPPAQHRSRPNGPRWGALTPVDGLPAWADGRSRNPLPAGRVPSSFHCARWFARSTTGVSQGFSCERLLVSCRGAVRTGGIDGSQGERGPCPDGLRGISAG